MMLNAGIEFKRIRVRNIVNFIPNVQKTHPMLIGNGIFHITGKITLTGQIPRLSVARARFITENQSPSQVNDNASFLFHNLRREINVDFTISLDQFNGRRLFFQGEVRSGRNFSPAPFVFNGHIDQIG